jgi:lactoylglutathione lyase
MKRVIRQANPYKEGREFESRRPSKLTAPDEEFRATHNVRLLVSDVDACFLFYRDALGLPVLEDPEGGPYGALKAGPDVAIGLFRREFMTAAISSGSEVLSASREDRVALILEVDDIDEVFARVARAGSAVVQPPTDRPEWGLRTAHVRDPDGNLIELMTPISFDPTAQA